jgi:hypothetical protein
MTKKSTIKSNLNIYPSKGRPSEEAKDVKVQNIAEIIGWINRYYQEGENLNVYTDEQKTWLKAVESAHQMMQDISMSGLGDINVVANKIQSLYNLNRNEVMTILDVARNVFSQKSETGKHYMRMMYVKKIESFLTKCEKAGDMKTALKYMQELKEISELTKEEDNDSIEFFNNLTINFVPNPELLNNYDAEDDEKLSEAIRHFELEAKKKLGQ